MPTRIASMLLALLGLTSYARAAQTCDEAWSAYNEFKRRNVMEESQYPVTTYGAAVRAACGAEALPVPPGTDTPHRPVVRKPNKPVEPPRRPASAPGR